MHLELRQMHSFLVSVTSDMSDDSLNADISTCAINLSQICQIAGMQ